MTFQLGIVCFLCWTLHGLSILVHVEQIWHSNFGYLFFHFPRLESVSPYPLFGLLLELRSFRLMFILPPITSLHNQSYFTPYKSYFAPCKKLVKHYHELFVLMLELDWFWTYVSSDLSTNAASHICSHLVTQNIILFDYSPQYKFLYVVIPQNPRYCIKEILEGVSWLILIVLLPTFQYTFTGVIGNVVSLLPYVNGWKRAMTMHNWNGTRELYASNAGR